MEQRVPEVVDSVVPQGQGNDRRLLVQPEGGSVYLRLRQRLQDDEPNSVVGHDRRDSPYFLGRLKQQSQLAQKRLKRTLDVRFCLNHPRELPCAKQPRSLSRTDLDVRR